MRYLKILIYPLLMFIYPYYVHSENKILTQINSIRNKNNLSILTGDPLLSRTAELYSQELYFRGKLEHKDQYGNSALERYRRMKGTAITIGEILGAGDNENQILLAWMESTSHRNVILYKEWTHCGVGIYTAQNLIIIVALFTRETFSDLQIEKTSGKIRISGHFSVPGINSVIIRQNGKKIVPTAQIIEAQFFQFNFNPADIAPCLELGYIDKNQFFVLTDIIYPFKY